MHEMSLVQALFVQLQDLAREHKKSRVVSVQMEIGPLSGVVTDSFQFGFEILARQTPLTHGATLQIRVPTATYRCSGCGHSLETVDRPQQCPQCKECFFIPEGGDEILLSRVEME